MSSIHIPTPTPEELKRWAHEERVQFMKDFVQARAAVIPETYIDGHQLAVQAIHAWRGIQKLAASEKN